VGKFVNEDVAQNSTIHDFFRVAQKESNKVVHENINDTNKQKHRKIMCTDSSKASSTGNSFFMKYLKQHSATKCAETSSGVVSVGTHERRPLDDIDLPKTKHVLDTNSDDDMFESPLTNTEKQKKDKSNLLARTMTSDDNLEVPTSMIENQTDDDTSKMWISLGELFPDISKIDDDVVALLPVPLQERLQARIEKAKNSRISSKCVLTNIATSSNNIDTTDCWFDASHSQDETEQGVKDVEAFVHAAECVMPSEMEKQSYNKNMLPKATNLCCHSDDQKDDLLSETHCVFQCTKEESSIVPPDAKQQYLNASHVPFVSEENDAEKSESIVAEYCPQCRKDVPLDEYPEHLDFHTAEKLHKELNGVATHVTNTVNASALHKNASLELPTKRKHSPLRKKPPVIDRNKKMRSITAFFAPK
jgi:hypothetical protein